MCIYSNFLETAWSYLLPVPHPSCSNHREGQSQIFPSADNCERSKNQCRVRTLIEVQPHRVPLLWYHWLGIFNENVMCTLKSGTLPTRDGHEPENFELLFMATPWTILQFISQVVPRGNTTWPHHPPVPMAPSSGRPHRSSRLGSLKPGLLPVRLAAEAVVVVSK